MEFEDGRVFAVGYFARVRRRMGERACEFIFGVLVADCDCDNFGGDLCDKILVGAWRLQLCCGASIRSYRLLYSASVVAEKLFGRYGEKNPRAALIFFVSIFINKKSRALWSGLN